MRIIQWIRGNSLTYCMGYVVRKAIRNRIERNKLKNKDISILCQNCIGGVMLHDLGLQFQTPTINLYMSFGDFVVFLEHLNVFLGQEITFVNSERKYPKGVLFYDDNYERKSISLYFPHDKDYEKINCDWQRRSKRVNYKNIYIIATDRDGLTTDLLERFSELTFIHKILLSSKPYKEYDFVQYFPQYKDQDQVTSMISIINMFGKREYQQGWDYIQWLNNR